MNAQDWLVFTIAAAAIGLESWWFLGPKRAAQVAAANGIQEATVRVKGGYDPSVIEVAAGKPLRLVFDRQEENPCSEELVIADAGIRRDLPAFQRTVVEFTPAPGRHEFTCGMGMLRGMIVAR